ncbi:period circadian protein isoform X2 [Anabrus simplex]|uniref:period circadian protein isoform X2 n=1 Tax=Anabrus simplex TaxID=316456 RepID=UPI0035A2E3F0
MEETATHKVSDSAYSNSSNSQSQRSSGSSKSHHSTSSGSSGYGGHSSTTTLGRGNDVFPFPQVTKRNKDKEHKKKKLKSATITPAADHHVDPKSTSTLPSGMDVPPQTECNETPTNISSEILGIAIGNPIIPSVENGDLQKAAFSQTLHCISKLKSKDCPDVIPEEIEPVTATAESQEQTKKNVSNNFSDSEHCLSNENEFCTVISMHDGKVMYTTASITDVLGFPKDMWLGRSFIDFVHPKDRIAFANHITSGVAFPFDTHLNKECISKKNLFYCCLRQYRGLKSTGFGIIEKKVTCLPFRLTISFRELPTSEKLLTGEDGGHGIFLVITARLIKSAYTNADETRLSPKFLTRHLASCQLSYVDPEAVPYFGYSPQDMLGRSVFEFYHPEDLPFLKEVYQGVMKEQGHPFKSKPYRFLVHNGGYILLETEWSSFINPWSRKLEFVIGQHRVLKGPSNPNVFLEAEEDEVVQISEEVLKESKIIQEEIIELLNEVVRPSNAAKKQVSKRCKDLASFMETLMDEMNKPDLKVDLPTEEQTFSERDSAMLGEISPHHEFYDNYDSKSSTETPPSYNVLNYNENIQRFFESKPKTTLSDGSMESKIEVSCSLNSTDEEGKSSSNTERKCCSDVNGSGSGSGSSGSAGMPTSGASRGDTTTTNTSNGSYKPPLLTEALLFRHNEDMEKQMVLKHREQRNKSGDRESKMKKMSYEKLQEHGHGVKRSGSHSWEAEIFKASKHPHVDGNAGPVPNTSNVPSLYQTSPTVNLWPPFSITMTPLQSSQPCSTHSAFPSGNMTTSTPHVTSMIPVYYIPTGPQQARLPTQGIAPQEHPGPPQHTPGDMMAPGQSSYAQQVSFMSALPSMLYHPMQPLYGAHHLMYPSMMLQPSAVVPASIAQTGMLSSARNENTYAGGKTKVEGCPSGCAGPSTKFQRPASQATSVKAEPGSALGSIASASVNRAMSECSKKEKSLCSPGGRTSPNIGPFEYKSKDEQKNEEQSTRDLGTNTGDDSSYSSIYSFLRTEKSDESMRSMLGDKKNHLYPYKTEDMVWENSENRTSASHIKPRPVLKDPPWLEDVTVTPDLVYRYQMDDQNLENVLKRDLEALKSIHQPLMVNDQLSQLYVDLELEGLSSKLKLEEGFASSFCSDDGDGQAAAQVPEASSCKNKKQHSSVEYGRMVMIFEENAPLPPPLQSNVPTA